MELQELIKRVMKAERTAHSILSKHEASPSRIIHLEDLVRRLSGSPIDVQDYFNEAITCLEQKLYRAAIVMSWAGHFHVFVEKLYKYHEADIRTIRSKWQFKDLSEFKENFAEAHILEAGKVVKFIKRADLRILDGQLSLRNQCAHPTMYRPTLNSSIGYVDQMISQTLSYLEK